MIQPFEKTLAKIFKILLYYQLDCFVRRNRKVFEALR